MWSLRKRETSRPSSGFAQYENMTGNGTNYLHLCVEFRIIFDAHFYIPAVRFNFAEKFFALHHACETVAVVVEVDEIAVTEFLRPIRKNFRKNMRVHVNLQHRALAKASNVVG